MNRFKIHFRGRTGLFVCLVGCLLLFSDGGLDIVVEEGTRDVTWVFNLSPN